MYQQYQQPPQVMYPQQGMPPQVMYPQPGMYPQQQVYPQGGSAFGGRFGHQQAQPVPQQQTMQPAPQVQTQTVEKTVYAMPQLEKKSGAVHELFVTSIIEDSKSELLGKLTLKAIEDENIGLLRGVLNTVETTVYDTEIDVTHLHSIISADVFTEARVEINVSPVTDKVMTDIINGCLVKNEITSFKTDYHDMITAIISEHVEDPAVIATFKTRLLEYLSSVEKRRPASDDDKRYRIDGKVVTIPVIGINTSMPSAEFEELSSVVACATFDTQNAIWRLEQNQSPSVIVFDVYNHKSIWHLDFEGKTVTRMGVA